MGLIPFNVLMHISSWEGDITALGLNMSGTREALYLHVHVAGYKLTTQSHLTQLQNLHRGGEGNTITKGFRLQAA